VKDEEKGQRKEAENAKGSQSGRIRLPFAVHGE
jgi:hypothetical protein